MKVSIIQFSDLHLKPKNEKLFERIDSLIESIHSSTVDSKQIFIVYNGDLADKGQNFNNSHLFINTVYEKIKSKQLHRIVKNIFVPGNHDCTFEGSQDVRDALISTFQKKDSTSTEIIESVISVQNPFWSFYETQNKSLPANKLLYQIEYPLSAELNIVFNCFNTSWMSTQSEKVGELIFPNNQFTNLKLPKKSIYISVCHHPLPWFSPNTTLNNRKDFQRFLLENSNIVLTGHEHNFDASQSKDILSENYAYFVSADSLNEGGKTSGFNIVHLNTEENTFFLENYQFSQGIYVKTVSESNKLKSLKKNTLNLSKTYLDEGSKIPIPISHPYKTDLNKWDLFLYPDLEPIIEKDTAQFIDSRELGFTNESKVIIEGDSQSGKTSLLQKLQLDFLENNKVALYVNGIDLKGIDAEAYAKRALKSQYEKIDDQWQSFLKSPIDDRYILIDDVEKSLLNKEDKKKLFQRFETLFSKIFIISSNENEIHNVLKSESFFNDFSHFKILPFGKLKRNKMIETWLRLGKELTSIEEQELTHQIQNYFNQVSELLGEHLIPPHPIFVMTLLQSLNSTLNFNIEQTSYAYCYQSLIFVGLVKSGVDKDNLGAIINFLSHLAYKINRNEIKKIKKSDFEIFYEEYKKSFIIKYSSDGLLSILTTANLIQDDNDDFKFSYKYLFYYLIAKKMASDINKETINEVRLLCANLDKESNANILIFLVHHSGHSELIEELLFHSMLPFEKISPITLKSDDVFFKFLNEFINEISPEVIPKITNHAEERNKRLQDEDEKDRKFKRNKNDDDDSNVDDELRELIRSNKIIKILGQIVKNQQGSFAKSQLTTMLKESYLVCFRSISHVSNIIELAKPRIIEKILSDLDNGSDRDKVISHIKMVIHELGYRFCLQSFSNLSTSVGASNMDEIYDSVAEEIGTPAAKLISFTIKSYYGKLNVSDLEDLLSEFKSNPVAIDILRSRVKSYLYQHPVDYKKEQKIEALCKFKLESGTKRNYLEKSKMK